MPPLNNKKQYRSITFIIFLSLLQTVSYAMNNKDNSEYKILVIADVSESMKNKDTELTHIQECRIFCSKLLDSLYSKNKNVQFALRTFGDQFSKSERNCYDSKLHVGFAKQNNAQIYFKYQQLSPRGMTCMTYAINEALDKDIDIKNKDTYYIIVLTASYDNCYTEFCKLAMKVHERSNKLFIIDTNNSHKNNNKTNCLGKQYYLNTTNHEDVIADISASIQ